MIKWSRTKGEIELSTDNINEYEAPYDLVSQMRASFLIIDYCLHESGKLRFPCPEDVL